jgi:hypothetical protein
MRRHLCWVSIGYAGNCWAFIRCGCDRVPVLVAWPMPSCSPRSIAAGSIASAECGLMTVDVVGCMLGVCHRRDPQSRFIWFAAVPARPRSRAGSGRVRESGSVLGYIITLC